MWKTSVGHPLIDVKAATWQKRHSNPQSTGWALGFIPIVALVL